MIDPTRTQAGLARDGNPTDVWWDRPGRIFRLNPRAVVLLLVAVTLAVLTLLALPRFNARALRRQVLADAQSSVEAGNVDLAIRNLGRFLDDHPEDLPVLEEMARITADSARNVEEASAAAAVNDRLLRMDSDGSGRQDTRRRLVDLYVRCGDWHRASAIYRLTPESAAYDLKYRAAEAVARDLIRRGDSRPGDHRLLAMALEGLSQPGDREALRGSVEEYGRAIRGDPTDSKAAERLARLYQERLGEPARGEKILDDLAAALPTSPEPRLIRFRFFLKRGRDDRAAAELELATRLGGPDIEVRLAAAGDALRRGDGPTARGHLEAISPEHRDDLRVRVLRGMIDFNEERNEEAIDGWRRGLLSLGGTDADLTWWLAHALLRMGRVAEARPLVVQYRRLSGDEAQPLCRLLQAELDEKTGRPDRAIVGLLGARDKIGHFWQAMVHMALGRCYEATWDQARALAAYRRAGQIEPRLSEPRIAAARLLGARPDEAARELERGLAQAPDDPALRLALVEARLRQEAARPMPDRSWDRFDLALARARDVSPGHSALLLLQADRLALADDVPGAVALLEEGVARIPRNASLWIAMAEGLDRLGRPAEALRALDRAADAGAAGDGAPIRLARARLLLARGRGREARDGLVRGEGALPSSDRAAIQEALGRILAARGDARSARLAFSRWARLMPEDPRPRLALLELALSAGDAASVRATVEALRESGGTQDIAWRLCRAQELLWDRAAPDRPPSRRDPGLEEAGRLLEAVLLDAPEVPAAHLLRGRVFERQDRLDDAIASYRRAWDRGASAALPRLVDLLGRLRRFDDLAGLKLKVPALRLDQLAAFSSFRAGDADSARLFVEQAGQDGKEAPGTPVWQARMFETIGRPEESEAILRSVVERDPADVDAWLMLVRSLALHGKATEAARTIDRAGGLIRTENRPLDLARLAWAAGDRVAADREFRAALSERPGEVGALVMASRYFEETGRRAEAVARLRAARGSSPGDRAVVRQLAVLLSTDPATWPEARGMVVEDGPAGESAEDRLARALVLAEAPDPSTAGAAVARLESLLDDLPPGDAVAVAAGDRLARLLLRNGQAGRAAEVAAVAAEAGAEPSAVGLLAEALLRAGRLTEAGRQVERLEAIAPMDPAAAGLRVRWLVASSRPEALADALERAAREREARPGAEALGRAAFSALLEAGPKALDHADRVGRLVARARPSAWWMRARVLVRRGRPGEALDLGRGSDDSETADDRGGMAELAMEVASAPDLGPADRARAGALLDDALRRDPADYDVVVIAAMFRHLQGSFEDEARLYREALAIRPGEATASNNLAWVYSEHLGRPDLALPVLDEAIRRNGRSMGWILDTRGVVLTRLGRLDEAIGVLNEAASDGPSPAVLFHLARACRKAGRDPEYRRFRDQARDAGISPEQVAPTEREDLAAVMAP